MIPKSIVIPTTKKKKVSCNPLVLGQSVGTVEINKLSENWRGTPLGSRAITPAWCGWKASRDGLKQWQLANKPHAGWLDRWVDACAQSDNNPDLDTRRRRIVITRRAATVRTVLPKVKFSSEAVWGALTT